jgi:putative sugar O-methyltransferase
LHWTAKHGLINLTHRLSHRQLFDIQAKDEFRVGDSSITDSSTLATYPSLCGSAARNFETFKKFRSSRVLVEALDHVSIEQGNSYISEILKSGPWSEEFTKVLLQIDKVGNPRKFKFKPYGTFSPTLLRYLKVYKDLENNFGSLNTLKIAEIGIGFGGQASLISLLSNPSSYTLYDLPPVLELAQKFMNEIDAPGNFTFFDGRNPEPFDSDLVISNYAFSELNRDVQDQYLQNVVLKSPRGYITWNNLSEQTFGGYSLAELIRVIPNSQIRPEKPNTSECNAIIVWGI